MRYLFIRIQGRMSTIEAPVVPRTLAATAPTSRKSVLLHGVAPPFTLMWMPPETTNSEPIRVTYRRAKSGQPDLGRRSPTGRILFVPPLRLKGVPSPHDEGVGRGLG